MHTIENLVNSYFLPYISRFRDGKPLWDTPRIGTQQYLLDRDDQKLIFTDAHTSDSGIYKCIVSNKYGNISRTIDFKWRGKFCDMKEIFFEIL